ncbi:1-deoxy-D-xylulose-5-phosphate synthase [Paenibacillus thermoaerophilus]|uniref:1-deoxy-D-xylulose-5-phosphate synthase n=1 Tax=Paenibacillus thermoaerophilus TaxID=1215385 RepID=A0ABW2V8N3_9BACL|nr:1-deoxy-D-xylulose-5-phosphate synthase [Paenibacillus thermoaerophilus]TMV11986.1 1-deoxy-D-xylulose-5-phosphate synthase [Paenibacillus thermoaerophilus]
MLLDQIDSPRDLKALAVEQLPELAAEIRQFLIEKLSVTGGHLAPNLGVVELTIALHYLFDSPTDKFIFDVGHQSYVHKILTGRKNQFDTLRKYKGLSGFIKRKESEHDVWEAGHSSTSLSAAMGMAVARDLKGERNRIIAMIGDGALTGGMAFEALNHIGHERKNMIVVLNDNEMSIAPNVGALHNYLTKIRSDKHYLKAKEEVEHLLKKIPAIGGTLAKTAEKLKDSLKYLVVSGVLFEELGFNYIGPVDGHNLPLLLDTFRRADKLKGPVLVHVVTLKGKGYKPAEKDSHTWHGLGPYKIESGEVLKGSGPPMYTEVFAQSLIELARNDDRIVAVTPAMPKGSGLEGFARLFPGRMLDVGIAEQHAATLCASMALEGMKPVFAVYSTFLQRAYDQVLHDICRHNANVAFAIDRAGFVGADGETHQGIYDIAFLRSMPNMVLMMPKDENELRHMMKTALEYDKGPIAVRYPRLNGVGVPMDEPMRTIPIGKWEVVREGQQLAVLAVGPMVQLALEAAESLAKEGISVEVVNARFLKPLDDQMLMSLATRGLPILTIEEACLPGGFGSAVLEFYAERGWHELRLRMLGIEDRFIEHGSVKEQRAEVGLTAEAVMETARAMLKPQLTRQRA